MGFATVMRGAALAAKGQAAEGVAQIRQGIAAVGATGGNIARSYSLGILAEAQGQSGRREDGLVTVTEALAVVEKSEERFYEAELYRLKGELTSQSHTSDKQSEVPDEAEACFQKALDVARRQQAKSLELRAATSLARLWQEQGKKTEARDLLSEIYNWFTEGFDTKDLKDAKALLKELA